MEPIETFIQSQKQEISRGSVVIAVLWCLQFPQYGYALLDELERAGIGVEANTLYPLLRRLEQQGMLTSEWNTGDSRPRKYYVTSEAGQRALQELLAAWHDLSSNLETLTGKAQP